MLLIGVVTAIIAAAFLVSLAMDVAVAVVVVVVAAHIQTFSANESRCFPKVTSNRNSSNNSTTAEAPARHKHRCCCIAQINSNYTK